MNKKLFSLGSYFLALFILAVAPATGQSFIITGKCSIAKSGKVFLAYKDQKGGYINDSTEIKNG